MKNLIDFIKYHNAFPALIITAFVISSSAFAYTQVRENQQVPVDTSRLVGASFDSYDANIEVTSVYEDDTYVYVEYTYSTWEVIEGMWQPVRKSDVLKVEAGSMSEEEIEVYVTSELRERGERERDYLVRVQAIERARIEGVVTQEKSTLRSLLGSLASVTRPQAKNERRYADSGDPSVGKTRSEMGSIMQTETEKETEVVSTSTSTSTQSTDTNSATSTPSVVGEDSEVATSTNPVPEEAPADDISTSTDPTPSSEDDTKESQADEGAEGSETPQINEQVESENGGEDTEVENTEEDETNSAGVEEESGTSTPISNS
ncbi:MAG: hypothetical protein WD579_00520 [Candidatus Paceibacterota bacterium]